MAGFQQNNNSGALFRNDRKQQPNQPDHTGTALIDGKEYYISAWVKTSGRGNKFFSLAFDLKESKPQTQQQPAAEKLEDFSDDVPF